MAFVVDDVPVDVVARETGLERDWLINQIKEGAIEGDANLYAGAGYEYGLIPFRQFIKLIVRNPPLVADRSFNE